ncbi:fibronectin-binding protein [Bdellovibrio bacteriovorus]|uniref:Fibronectin-binding protein n=1 Tax=Bdellovibrio bacteriovorus TaxID=959 RepID=A0A150WEP6_BDEBC|nr:DUF814 domain-containing protein [Bdellovibrio bacteriovorus]KYG61499.1 fibronectin-binding protein [Bdellovibrio bacteriovorus]
MKALTQQELQHFIAYFAPILDGAQLQDVQANDRGLALGFQGDRRYWMILDLLPNTPMMLVFEEECPFQKGLKGKPVGLFLNSHAKNLYLTEMTVLEEYGRVVRLMLRNSSLDCELEIRLIPKQANFIVRANGKQISWDKVLELGAAPPVENPPAPRTLEEIHEEWLGEQKGGKKPAQDPVAQWEKQKAKDLEKKRKALAEIQKQIDSDEDQKWASAGNYLKENVMEGAALLKRLPPELTAYVNLKESLSWNIETAFAKAKQLAGKRDGARERLVELAAEISKLENSRYSAKAVTAKSSLPDLMKKAEARGRKLHLDSGALAYCGKSAADNLALLRQAKAWDYWLHLKDYPGAHAIIHRQRDQLIPDLEIQEVAEWLAKESLSSKSLNLGQKVAVVMVECRFVRPIKGDKLGRVNYHSEKTFNFIMK